MAGKLLKYLPRSMSFSIPSSSSTISKAPAFSGPIVSIIPKEARRKKKGSGSAEAEFFEELTSPKVSCIGQVKHKNCSSSSKIKNNNKNKKQHQSFNERVVAKREEETKKKMTKKPSAIQGMFRRKVRPGRTPVPATATAAAEEEVAPEVGSIRRYASGREMLGDFDWRKVVVVGPEEEEEEEEEEVLVAHSGPILLGGGVVAVEVEKRKEVSLWKRRTLAPHEPMRLQT